MIPYIEESLLEVLSRVNLGIKFGFVIIKLFSFLRMSNNTTSRRTFFIVDEEP